MGVIYQDDFSGGVEEATSPSHFGSRDCARAEGFVLEGDGALRTQWAMQKLPTTADDGTDLSAFRDSRVFAGHHHDWLVVMGTGGNVYAMTEPDPSAAQADLDALTWTTLTGSSDYKTASWRFAGVAPASVTGRGRVSALWCNGVEVADVSGGRPDQAMAIYELADGSGLATAYVSARYPELVTGDDGELTPAEPVVPHAVHGAMWRDFWCLGNMYYLDDPDADAEALDGTNTARWRNALWISVGGYPAEQFHPLHVVSVGDPDAPIVGLHEHEDALLVVKTDGVFRVVGAPPDDLRVETVRGDLRLHRDAASFWARSQSAAWPEIGAVCFVDARGQVWAADLNQAYRIDQRGPRGAGRYLDHDHTCAFGPYLLAWRGKRLLCMRSFGEEGSWTELVHPNDQVRAMDATGSCVYFVARNDGYDDGPLWRIAPFAPAAERACHAGTAITARFAGPTQRAPAEGASVDHARAHWTEAGLRLDGGDGAQLTRAAVRFAPALVAGAETAATSARDLGPRAAVPLAAGGGAIEACVTCEVTGDVTVESAELVYEGQVRQR